MDVTQQVIDAFLLPLAVFGGTLLILLLLVLRLTYHTSVLARRQRKLLTLIETALDSIESGTRWGTGNLVDGIYYREASNPEAISQRSASGS